MRWLGPKKRAASVPPDGDIAAQCQAFLAGTSRLWLEAQGRPVPAWAWINQLAHGDQDRIEAAASAAPRGGSPESLISCLAVRLVQVLGRHPVDLSAIQVRTLLPHESSLITAGAPPPRTDADLAWMLSAAVVAQQQGSRRPEG